MSLNHKKTSIHRLPEAAVEQWIRKINSITLLTNYGKMDYKYCRAYLDYAIEIFKHEGYNSAVLKYALKVMNGIEMTDNAKKYEQQTVFHLCILYPYLVPLLDKYIFQHCSTSIEEIKHIANLIYCNSIDNLAYEAVSYAIYFAIKYKFSIEKADVKQLITCEDCIVLILAYKYFLSQNDNEA